MNSSHIHHTELKVSYRFWIYNKTLFTIIGKPFEASYENAESYSCDLTNFSTVAH